MKRTLRTSRTPRSSSVLFVRTRSFSSDFNREGEITASILDSMQTGMRRERGVKRTIQRMRERQFSLYEFNPALSRHRLLFQPCGGKTRWWHDVAARRCKRRVLFHKCAPGNWSSCCSSVGSFSAHHSFAILIKTSRKEVPIAVQSA